MFASYLTFVSYLSQPCRFTCTNGYTLDAQSNTCVCPAPYTVDPTTNVCTCAPPYTLCDGQCTAGTCGPTPTAVLGRAAYKRKMAVDRHHTYCEAQGARACGVLGVRDGWECVDTTSDLESCASCFVCLLLVFF